MLWHDEDSRDNSLNVIRLLLAVLVIFSHAYPLTRGSDVSEPLYLWARNRQTFGALAVALFFAVSGFLIVRSYLFSTSMDDYFRKRVLRIYPAFLVAVAVSALLALMTAAHPWHYLRAVVGPESMMKIVTLGYGSLDLPEVFTGNPHNGVNGSLWTIPYEFLAYILIAAFGLFGLFRYRVLWLLATCGLALLYARDVAGGGSNQLYRVISYFAAGASAYIYRAHIPRSRIALLLAIALMIAGLKSSPWILALSPFAATYVVLFIGARKPPRALAWTKKTDISYGVYLYAFPVSQSLVFWFHVTRPMDLFWMSVPPTVMLALASWHLIERPALQLKRSPTFGASSDDTGRPARIPVA